MTCHKVKYSWIKMENRTVVQLKAIAKDRGIWGYYKLRKAELIRVLQATKLVEQKSKIFNEPIPNDPTPVLQPTPWRQSNFTTKFKQKTKNFITMGMQKIRDFGEWLLNYIPTKPKVVDNCLSLLKPKLKKCMKIEIVSSNQHRPNLLWRIWRFSIEWKDQMVRPRIISA